MNAIPPPLVLASSSSYRRALLARLGIPFVADAPDVDESPRPGEHPAALVERLALDKARVVAARHPRALVIGSDQCAELAGEPVGKPGDHAAAVAQLRAAAGRTVKLYTGLAVVDAPSGRARSEVVTCQVRFRPLDDATIERYLAREQPYDCTGAVKAEGLGIALLAAIECDDPSALIGLPLIRLTEMLESEGLRVV